MSLLVIKGHVKDGLELAREYGLPHELREFISTHHGTTLVEYFYHAASQRKEEADRALDEVEFRYGGPKPRSKAERRAQAQPSLFDLPSDKGGAK
jgi:membrane-associated HD superfamily phosphohydrolase